MTARPDRTRAVVGTLRITYQRLVEDGPTPGPAWCARWADAVDEGLRTLADAVPAGRWCLVAAGGYGRAELCPGSDVDVWFLHDTFDEAQLAGVVRDVVYPLWDAQLKVGYAVRSPTEAVASVDDLDTATALLDARPVAGDAALLREVQDRALRRLRRRPDRFLDALTRVDDRRRAAAGDAAEALEPDLKNGAGGLRDVQSLRWAAAVLLGTPGLDPLVSAGYLGADDRSRLARAYDRLLAERVATHLAHGRGTDVVTSPVQEQVATRLGHVDGDGERDSRVHRLLSAHFLAARTVDHVHERAWRLITADATAGRRRRRSAQAHIDGFEIVDGVLRLPRDADVTAPDLPMRLFHGLARTRSVLDRRTAAALRRASEHRPWSWADDDRRRFLATLWRGEDALTPLAELDDTDVLTSMLPEWEPVRGRAQRNPFHRWSLDRHAWHAAAALAGLVRTQGWAARAHERVEDRDALMLGTFLHDVGKAHGEPHVQTGVPVARAICDLLAALHLLAAADGLATGPSAWTAWKANLVGTLVGRVAAVLDETHPDEVADGAVVTIDQAPRLAVELGTTADAVRDHLASLPRRYAAAVDPRAVVRHTLLATAAPGPTEVRTRVTPGRDRPEAGLDAYDQLDVVAVDAPGRFARVVGVIALNGGSVVGASAFTRDDGAAVDTFTLVPPDGAPASWWPRVEGDLVEAVAGRLALRARVGRRARQEQRRLRKLPEVTTTVDVRPDESKAASVIEVRTQDRVGALFAIADALAELALDVVVARVQTIGHEAVDVFTVRDADGHPLDQDHVTEVRLAVTTSLAALGTAT